MPDLDPQRVSDARKQASELTKEAEYHETRAAALRARAALLARTWGFDAGD